MYRHRLARSAPAARVLAAMLAALGAVFMSAAPAHADTIDQIAAGLKGNPLYVTSNATTNAFGRPAQTAAREALTSANTAIRVAVVRAGLLTSKQQADQFVRQIQRKVGASGTYAVVTTDGKLYAISNVLRGPALAAISNGASRKSKEIGGLIIEFAKLTDQAAAAVPGAQKPDDGFGVGSIVIVGILSAIGVGGGALAAWGIWQRRKEREAGPTAG